MSEAENWAGAVGRTWAQHADALDRQLEPAGEVGLARLQARPGEAILDLGCGSGATTAKIAAAVGPEGMVTGVDISADQIAIATARPGNGGAELIAANAEHFSFGRERFDAIFSRFGCMFFDDPPAAFANFIAAMKPGGRICLVAWSDISRNPWAAIPNKVGTEVLGPADPVPLGTPGPFSWSDPAVFRRVLEGAGFRGLAWNEEAITLPVGEESSASPAARAAQMLTQIGPLARRLAGKPEEIVERAVSRLQAELVPFVQNDWVRMPGAVWVIQAVR